MRTKSLKNERVEERKEDVRSLILRKKERGGLIETY